jgi:hypothetical protein
MSHHNPSDITHAFSQDMKKKKRERLIYFITFCESGINELCSIFFYSRSIEIEMKCEKRNSDATLKIHIARKEINLIQWKILIANITQQFFLIF